MNPANLIPSLQSDALAHEIERQLNNETSAVIAAAQRDARVIIAQARATAQHRVHETIQELRREGAHRLSRANAQLETEQRARAQRQAAQAVATHSRCCARSWMRAGATGETAGSGRTPSRGFAISVYVRAPGRSRIRPIGASRSSTTL